MFNLDLSNSYWWPVKISTPRETGAVHDVGTFDCEFRRLPQADIDAFMARAKTERTPDSEVAPGLVVGWKGVTDRNGAPVPFSAQNLERMLAVPGTGSAIVKAFFESLVGAAEKN